MGNEEKILLLKRRSGSRFWRIVILLGRYGTLVEHFFGCLLRVYYETEGEPGRLQLLDTCVVGNGLRQSAVEFAAILRYKLRAVVFAGQRTVVGVGLRCLVERHAVGSRIVHHRSGTVARGVFACLALGTVFKTLVASHQNERGKQG